MTRKYKALALALGLLAFSVSAVAQQSYSSPTQNIFYVGAGSSTGDAANNENDETAWSLGWIYKTNGFSFGVDIAGEGTSYDSTTGYYNDPRQGVSFNLIALTPIMRGQRWTFDGGVLLGAVQSGRSCKSTGQSYLGYECYADQDPDTEYDFNYGAVGLWTSGSISVGLRATKESTQAILGMQF